MQETATGSSMVLVLLWFILIPTTFIFVHILSDTHLPGSARMLWTLGAVACFVALAATTTTFWFVATLAHDQG